MKKIPTTIIGIIIAVAFLSLVQIIFRIPVPHENLRAVWEAGDFINYVAAVVFGIFAAYKSKQAHDLKKMQLYSIITQNKVMFAEKSTETPEFNNFKMKKDLNLNFLPIDYAKGQCFHFDIEFENQSDYPVTSIAAKIENIDVKQFGVLPKVEKAVNFAARKAYVVRIIIPSKIFNEQKIDEVLLNITFRNIYTCDTNSTFRFSGIQKASSGNRFNYHEVKAEFNLNQIANLGNKEDNQHG